MLIHKNVVLAETLISNIDYEMKRISNRNVNVEEDGIDYKTILMRFGANSKAYQEKKDIMEDRKNNFFFGIYGFGGVLFEIDTKTGLLYANRMFGKVERLNANEYLRKYEGEVKIRELTKGNYDEVSIGIPCEDTGSVAKVIYFKVNTVD